MVDRNYCSDDESPRQKSRDTYQNCFLSAEDQSHEQANSPSSKPIFPSMITRAKRRKAMVMILSIPKMIDIVMTVRPCESDMLVVIFSY